MVLHTKFTWFVCSQNYLTLSESDVDSLRFGIIQKELLSPHQHTS